MKKKTTKSPTVAQMQRHIASMVAEHGIIHYTHIKRTDQSGAFTEFEEIRTPPVRSAITYAVALHEIGHVLGRHQHSRRALVRERWARRELAAKLGEM